MYFLLGISLSLAFLLGVNLIVGILSAASWRTLGGKVAGLSAPIRGRIIFSLRILPLAAAIVFVAVFVVPAYILYEPETSGEIVSTKLAIISGISSLAVVFAFFRVCRTWFETRRLITDWLRIAQEIQVEGVDIPAYRIEHPFPIVAVVGILRPRLFVARNVIETLSEAEFRSAVAHEYGHLDANDNLKRTILRASRDLLVLPFGKHLDRSWSDSAETAADEYAARCSNASAFDLASALIKIAKMVTSDLSPAVPQGAFLLGEQVGDITERVRHLIELGRSPVYSPELRFFGFSGSAWLLSAIFAMLVILPLADTRVLSFIQFTTERIVAVLQ